MLTIERYEQRSDGKFYLEETFTTDSIYWRVENGVLYYTMWDIVRSVCVERSKCKMCMSEQEAIENNCGCYYKVNQ